MQDYFKIFGLKRQFDINPEKLDDAYFELQRQFHPDVFKNSKQNEAEAMQKSALYNLAYKTLQNPQKRAEYMIGDEKLEASPELLMEMMELRESGNVDDVKKEIAKLYKQFAKTEDKETFVRIKYLSRFIEESKN
ncbi:MAG: Fe-S protein assembly co-chaperone HscB [Alphaproteobacteria bacterium CG11_big_fil_rev_8_21_14_0_20_44_7]|nr:MAG: Fe-S protein assembly co-chaperone HscB [Alphaproteobacteria bacterium CG11_big_fil_rev_8_21_14_0_20_44_7]